MARAYAGVLGSLSMAVVMLRGAIAGAGFEGTVANALPAVALMGAVGFIVGWIAEATIDESVRSRLEKQLAELEQTTEATV